MVEFIRITTLFQIWSEYLPLSQVSALFLGCRYFYRQRFWSSSGQRVSSDTVDSSSVPAGHVRHRGQFLCPCGSGVTVPVSFARLAGQEGQFRSPGRTGGTVPLSLRDRSNRPSVLGSTAERMSSRWTHSHLLQSTLQRLGTSAVARTARKKSESGIYHVMLRGIDHREIFIDDEDCQRFLDALEQCVKGGPGNAPGDGFSVPTPDTSDTGDGSAVLAGDRTDVTVPVSSLADRSNRPSVLFAYCLMGNHVHLLLREGAEGLSSFMKRVGVRYVYWYNWKYQRTGHLFQDRFRSEAVETDEYFLTALRYIYQNPVKAGLCEDIGGYRWSSYGVLKPNKDWPLDPPEFTPELEAFLREPGEEVLLDMDREGRVGDRDAGKLICELAGLQSSLDFVSLPTETQRQLILQLRDDRLSIRQLARLTGLSKGIVEKYLQ